MKRRGILVAITSFLLLTGVGFAVFGDKAEIQRTSVSVGSADLKLLNDLAGGVETTNLVDSKTGPVLSDITPNWSYDYGVILFNNGTSSMRLSSWANYETANDPAELRQLLFVEPFVWSDTNNNGAVESDELGTSFGRKTIVKWKSEGFTLPDIPPGDISSYVLRFSTDAIPDSKQGAQAVFDFYFDAQSGN